MRAVPHRSADVEQQMAVEVRLLLELLDVVAVSARVDLPVDRGQIVARNVLAVLRGPHPGSPARAAGGAGPKPPPDRPPLCPRRPPAPSDPRGPETTGLPRAR